ncbi:ABC transporter ATP-binding protein [Candidatus Thioglobus autotrophicus]|uniref:ABC transporter ATP-binding protein n=1 Tax=Candidatus Thioglobus autotrophicus TaxID=1705394 RepID=UPI00299EDCD1|nr:ABC transporter ATP-binding protein [Candidatus Thioglobus autotrophicus]WPE17755.1 ABC transporter ATP-binding protein [Candidatus Thioglobus autotrophicus]
MLIISHEVIKIYKNIIGYRPIIYLLSLSFFSTLTELFGLTIFLPIFQYLRLEGDISALTQEHELWEYVITSLNKFNIEISLPILLVTAFLLFLIRQVFVYFRLVYKTVVSQKLIQHLRRLMFDRYLSAKVSYYDRLTMGDFVNSITTELSSAVFGIMTPVELALNVILALGYVSILTLISWEMTLLSLAVLLLVSRIPRIWIKQSADVGRRVTKANTSTLSFLVDRIKSPRLVKLSGTGEAEMDEYKRKTHIQRKLSVLASQLNAKTEISIEPLAAAVSLLFIYIFYAIMEMKIEAIGMYLLIMMRLIPSLKTIINTIQAINKFKGPVEFVDQRLKEMLIEKESNKGSKLIKKIINSIVFKDVSFQYPSTNHYALKNINFQINTGELVAVVGASGSGKSTLIDLIPLLRRPTNGAIEIDGANLNKYNIKDLRALISYSPQDPQIFHGTIANHIRYGDKEASDKDIISAAKLAGIHDFVQSLPDQYSTHIHGSVNTLSGGQRQRLDLARALIKKSEVLILDEPTSSLDKKTEKDFYKTIYNLHNTTNITIIIVTHQINSIVNYDKILVLDNGSIDSFGSHDELIKYSQWYRNSLER